MSEPTFREALDKLSSISLRVDGEGHTRMMLEWAGPDEYHYLRDNLHALLWKGLALEEAAKSPLPQTGEPDAPPPIGPDGVVSRIIVQAYDRPDAP